MQATDIIKGLEGYLSCPVIFAEQAAPKPPYPYVTIKELVSFIPASGQGVISDEDLPEDIKRTSTSQPTMSLSVTVFGTDILETGELAQMTHDWFAFAGYRYLKEKGYVIADIQSIMNRDSLVVDDYERKRGFDVKIRFIHSRSRIVEEIKVVKGTINNKSFTKEVNIID